ncbi:MAG: hypothetical protein J6Y53_01805 [Alphaproteobacteria bacterium]|nr:hypothetical protein [Alphaproteobacteria bacterium]
MKKSETSTKEPRRSIWKRLQESKAKKFILTTLAFMTICSAASAQSKEKQQKDSTKVKTTLNVGFQNISALSLHIKRDADNKVCYPVEFYNDLMPTFNASVSKNGFYANASAAQLIILKNKDISTLNNKCFIEIGKQFGNGATLYIKSGRDISELASNFINGVATMNLATDAQRVAAFGNLSDVSVLGVKTTKDGKTFTTELGIIAKNGDSYFVFPNPQKASVWNKMVYNMEKDGFKFSISAAASLGESNKMFVSTSTSFDRPSGKYGIAAGANYSFDNKEWNAYVRTSFTAIDDGMTSVAEVAKQGKTCSLLLGFGKNGVQGFVECCVETQKDDNNKTTVSTPSVGVGVSYSFGGSRPVIRSK